ncbi:hypothetical protein SLA2020_157850 [Shorea laevis]
MASCGVLVGCSMLIYMMMVPGLQAQAALSCGDMKSDVSPCIFYLLFGGHVSSSCCNGVQTIFSSAQTTLDRQNICNCLKSAIDGIPYSNANLRRAAELPGKCGVYIPYKISPSIDCNG